MVWACTTNRLMHLNALVEKYDSITVNNHARNRERPKLTWTSILKNNLNECGLCGDNALD